MDKVMLSGCRICLVRDIKMRSVDKYLQELYEKLTTAPFQRDNRPSQMCYICCARLKNCYRLHISCLQSEQFFNEIPGNNELSTTPTTLHNLNTLKIVHPLINLSCVSMALEDRDYDIKIDENNSEMIVDVQVKGETIEATEDNIDDEVGHQYTASDIFKTEDFNAEDNNTCYNIHRKIDRKAKSSFPKTAELSKVKIEPEHNIQATEDELFFRKVDAIIENDLKPDYSVCSIESTDICPKIAKIVLNRIDLNSIKTNKILFEDPKNNTPNIKRSRNQLNIHTVKKQFKCHICEKYFSRKDKLLAHIVTHSIQKVYKCDICMKHFNHKGHLKRHTRIHTGDKPYKCDICEKCFSQNNDLLRHSLLHTSEKLYKCDICKHEFTRRQVLIRHIRIHTGEKPFRCDVCQQCFSESGDLKKHSRKHTGVKPYKCDVCEKYFSRRGDLKRHSLIHSGEKPFECDICKKCFSRNYLLNSHFMLKHGDIT